MLIDFVFVVLFYLFLCIHLPRDDWTKHASEKNYRQNDQEQEDVMLEKKLKDNLHSNARSNHIV